MGYREHPVPLRWRGLAECVWTSAAPAAAEVIDVLPDGCMDLVWSGAELFVAGPDTAPHPFERTAGVAATGCGSSPGSCPRCSTCRLRPCVTRAFRWTRCTPHSPGACVAALAAGGPAAPALTALAARLPGAAPEPGLRAAATAAGAAVARPRRLRTTLGWTTRTLHRRCLTAFGYGPSVLRRVLRFRRAVALLRAGVAPAEVAAQAGYADQPHLSRDVRAFAGVSPARLAPSRAE